MIPLGSLYSGRFHDGTTYAKNYEGPSDIRVSVKYCCINSPKLNK